jgi:hypothetical protein
MGYEPESTLLARQLLPVCLPTRPSIHAMGSFRNLVYLPTVDGESVLSWPGDKANIYSRTVVYIATRVAKSISRFPIRHTAKKLQPQLV